MDRHACNSSLSEEMPLDDAMAVWSEVQSSYQCVAKLAFSQQDIRAIGQEAFGQNLAFNNWRTLPADEPLGSIAAEGRTLPVMPAWVISAPPDYALLQKSVRTM